MIRFKCFVIGKRCELFGFKLNYSWCIQKKIDTIWNLVGAFYVYVKLHGYKYLSFFFHFCLWILIHVINSKDMFIQLLHLEEKTIFSTHFHPRQDYCDLNFVSSCLNLDCNLTHRSPWIEVHQLNLYYLQSVRLQLVLDAWKSLFSHNIIIEVYSYNFQQQISVFPPFFWSIPVDRYSYY
jgi:hypothetical protein